MKIGVIGIGAVGGYFGGKLAKTGNDVTFIARGKTLEVMKNTGLIIKSCNGDFNIENPKVSSDLSMLKETDLILLCVKSYNTEEIAKTLKSIISENTTIVSMQNGIENEEILAEILGIEKIIGAAVYITSGVPEPGVINHTSHGRLVLGELNGEITDRIKNLEKLFFDSNIAVTLSSNIKQELWSKLMLNAAYNGFTAIVRNSLVNFQEISEAQESFYKILKEAQFVAQKEGYNISDEVVENVVKFTKMKNFGSFKSSTLLDIEAGKFVEVEALNGAIIRAAKKHNLDIPLNKFLYALLKMSFN